MLIQRTGVTWLACGAFALCATAAVVTAQARGRGAAPPAAGAGQASTQVHGNLAQVMRSILFPNSNIAFAIQSLDPATVKPEADPALAINPLASTYGGWQAVEGSGIAIAEGANLLTIPGRRCSNGKPVPLANADWKVFVQGLRDAGMGIVKAAQAKNMDAFLDVTDKLATACSNCHDVYREKTPEQGGLAARCTK